MKLILTRARHTRLMAFMFFLLQAVTTVQAQWRYCNSYEDYLDGRWEHLDTVFTSSQGKGWGVAYTFTTGSNDLTRQLKKDAFLVAHAEALYINCRRLSFESEGLGKGYIRALPIGERSLLIVSKPTGREATTDKVVAFAMFGLVGAAIAGSLNARHQVCYVVSGGAEEKGRMAIRMIDDGLMNQMLAGHDDLRSEYYAEEDTGRRVEAGRVVPLLERAGLFHSR